MNIQPDRKIFEVPATAEKWDSDPAFDWKIILWILVPSTGFPALAALLGDWLFGI